MTKSATQKPIAAEFNLGFDRFLEPFCTAVAQTGMKVVQGTETATITLSRGTIHAEPKGDLTLVTLSPKDAIGEQVLRDLLDRIAGLMTMDINWVEKKPQGHPANLSISSVHEVQRISPSFIRVTVSGPDLDRFATGGLHFTLPQTDGTSGWPYTDDGGVTRWPKGIGAWHRPVFTTRSVISGSQGAQLTFDVFLHDTGRTPVWAKNLSVGDEVALMGPSGSSLPEPRAYLAIVADETALPVAARILTESATNVCGQAVFFVPDAKDIQSISAPEGVKIRWVQRSSGETPIAALKGLDLPESDRYVLFAGEKSEAAQAREVLGKMGLIRGEFLAASYWSAT